MTIINRTTSESSTMQPPTPLYATDYNVYINHTDAGGIVYHANHLIFFENCRRDWFTELGINGYFLETINGQVQHFVVSQADLLYKKAIMLDEVIEVRIDKVELKPASIIFYQSIHRRLTVEPGLTAIKPSDSLLSTGKIVIACVQNQIIPESTSKEQPAHTTNPMRPVRVPQKLYDAILHAQNHYNVRP